MKFLEYLQKNGIKVPSKKETSDDSGVPGHIVLGNKGWNKAIDAFQPILDLDIGEPLDEEKLIKVMHECGHPDDLEEYAKAICRESRQLPLRLPSEKELDEVIMSCQIAHLNGYQSKEIAKAILAEIERRNK